MSIKYKNKEWLISATRNASFLNNLKIGGYTKTPLYGAPNFPTCIVINIDTTKSSYIFEKKEWNKFGEGLVEFAYKPKNMKALEKKYQLFAKNFLKSTEQFNKKINLETYDKFLKNYEIMGAGLVITLMLGRVVYEELQRVLEGKVNQKDLDEVIGLLTYPEVHTPLSVSRIELLKIAKKNIKDKSKLEKALDSWLKDFGQIPVNFAEEPWLLDDAKKQLKEISKNPEKVLKEIEKNHKDKILKRKRILKQINDIAVTNLSDALAKTTILNEFRKQVFCKVSLGYRDAYKKLAEKAGGSHFRDCFHLTPTEMRNIILGKKVDILKIKEERKDLVGCIFDRNGKWKILPREDLKMFLEDSIFKGEKDGVEVTLLKGQVANKGVARGVVKVIERRDEFGKFNPGDILVAPMTSVDYVPIMGVAGAFVTNEGGITSHASIVSREMNKPCIIGTKIATKVLKDGDFVEVDAEKGVVTILKRAK